MAKLEWKPEGTGATDMIHMGQFPRTGSSRQERWKGVWPHHQRPHSLLFLDPLAVGYYGADVPRSYHSEAGWKVVNGDTDKLLGSFVHLN